MEFLVGSRLIKYLQLFVSDISANLVLVAVFRFQFRNNKVSLVKNTLLFIKRNNEFLTLNFG